MNFKSQRQRKAVMAKMHNGGSVNSYAVESHSSHNMNEPKNRMLSNERTLHFKSEKAYKKWVAFGNIHGVFKKAPGNTRIFINGKPHAVIHNE